MAGLQLAAERDADTAKVTHSERNFRLLWTATSATNLADGLIQISLPLLATRLTQSPAAVAGVGVAMTLPWLLFALPVGALADRQDRRKLMLAANAARAVVVGFLALLTISDAVTMTALYMAAFTLGLSETVADTASQSILPAVVPAGRLESANARLFGAQTVTNEFIGPPLAGMLAGVAIALSLGTGTWLYLAALPLLVLMRGAFRPATAGRLVLRRDITSGLRFLRKHPLLRTLALFFFVTNVGWGAWRSIIVLFAVAPGPMELSTSVYGLLLTAMGVGGVLGTLVAVPLQRAIGSRWAIGADVLGTATMLGIPALTTNLWLIGGAIVIGGAGSTMWGVVVTSIRQQAVPDVLLGRVSSAFRLCGFGGLTLGAAGAGIVAELAGLRAVFATTAGLSLLLLIPFFLIVTNDALASARCPAGVDA
jgi:MFS family permease